MKIFLIITIVAVVTANAQVELQQSFSYSPPHFYFDALNFKSDSGGSRIDFYLQIPYNELQFVKQGNTFAASYEVNLQLTDESGTVALDRSWNEHATSNDFNETVSSNIASVTQRHFIVPPGTYTLQIVITDDETQKSYVGRRSFTARDYSASSPSLSDVMLLKASSHTDGKMTIVPNIEGNVISARDSFPVFYEMYVPENVDSVFVLTEIFGTKNKIVYSHSQWVHGASGTVKMITEIPKGNLPMGFYRLSITMKSSPGQNEPILANATRFFSIHFPELPLTITDLDKAADELVYIARRATIDSIKSAPDLFTKEKRFIAFWNRYNTNPSSKRNRLMEEYYNRVAYANEHFTHYFEGWKTDMGMVYILFGPPNSVDRHPFDIDSKPYEIWYYYERNRRFVFLDETGFGDYRLITPIWDQETPYGSQLWPR
ncbi:MAG: GWxTD domain-containing protein [Candidatus Kryptoniota bacterium]